MTSINPSEKNRHPRVSVVTVVKNGENFISEAVESILRQTLQDFEYIILDDCSSDKTGDILESFRDSRLKIIRLKSSPGYPQVRNTALGFAKAEFIAVLDADDVAHPVRLSAQIEFLGRNPSYGAVGSWARVFGEYETVRRPPVGSSALKASLLWGNPFIHSTMTIRRSALPREAEAYRAQELFAEDYGLWLRISRKWDLANLPLELINYRSHAGQLSELNRAVAAKSFLGARNEFLSGMGVMKIASLRPSLRETIQIADVLESRGWVESLSIYLSWVRSWLTVLKNKTLEGGRTNPVLRLFVFLGRKAKTQRRSRLRDFPVHFESPMSGSPKGK